MLVYHVRELLVMQKLVGLRLISGVKLYKET